MNSIIILKILIVVIAQIFLYLLSRYLKPLISLQFTSTPTRLKTNSI